MELSKLIELNKIQIRENECRKKQGLEQFRTFIKKHPFIKKCRQDDIFLLQFLRTRKYSMSDVYKTFENHFIFRNKHPEWLAMTSTNVEKMKILARKGFVYMSKDRDEQGCCVIIGNAEFFDANKFNSADAFNSAYIAVASLMEFEENQIMGYIYIFNYTNAPMAYFKSFTPSDVVEWVKSIQNIPGRYKRIIVLGLPAIANALFNLAKLAMSEKQRNRLLVLSNYEELCQHIDPSILPEKFGGKQSEMEQIEHYIKVVERNFEKLKESNDFEIDMRMVNCRDNQGVVGSFRMLEID